MPQKEAYLEHVRALTKAYGEVLARAGYDVALIHSGSIAKKTIFDDQDWPLRPTPHFQHWIPLAEPECFVIVRGDRKPVLVRPKTTSFWETAPTPPAPFLLDAFDVVDKLEMPAGKIVTITDKEHESPIVKALDELRTKKTPWEIDCIAEANRVARLGHDAVRDAFFAGETNELRLHLLYLEKTQQDDPETPYKNIVASGKNAATLHHVTYRKDASGAPSLLVDAGATCLGYCSDVTRTHVIADRSDAAQTFAAMVSQVDAMQRRLCDAAKIGMRYEALHDESHRQTSAILREIGLVRDLSIEEIDARGISRAFYPHGLGHSLGLQTHDVGCAVTTPRADNPFLRNTSIIETNQVFTIEPGLYFIDSLLEKLRAGDVAKYIDWKLVAALSPLGGVRIEDDVLVREGGGVRNFTREAFG